MTPTAARTVRSIDTPRRRASLRAPAEPGLSIAVIAILGGVVGACVLLALGGYIDADPARHGTAIACFLGALGAGFAAVAGIATLVRVPRPPPLPTLPAARIVDR